MTEHAKWKEEQELRKKKTAEAALEVVDLLKTKSLTYNEISDVLDGANVIIRNMIIVD